MKTIFKYNSHAKYSAEDIMGGCSNSLSLLDVYLIDKGPSVKIQLLNIFKDHYIVKKSNPSIIK